jgi:hypothetical protein
MEGVKTMPPKGVPTKIGAMKLAKLDEVGEDELFEQIADGKLVKNLIREMDVGWKLWGKWIDREDGRRGRYDAALLAAGHVFAERAVETAQNATPEDVNVSRLKVDTDKWMAAKRNAAYDVRQRDVAVNINIGDLHAQAAELLKELDKTGAIDGDFVDVTRDDDGEQEA